MKTLSSTRLEKAEAYLTEYPTKRSALLMVLRLIEEEFGHIDDEGMAIAADLCEVTTAHVQGMVTFYTHYKRPYHGKHRFMVCATLMCALDGNTDEALSAIKAKLGIGPGEKTTDGLFSCEKVECLADCDRAPVVQKDNEHFCSMKGEKLEGYIDGLLQSEGKSAADYKNEGPVRMDSRVQTLPVHFNFDGENTRGARRLDDKDPYLPPRNTTEKPRG